MGNIKKASALAVLASLGGVSAHSWVEALYRIGSNGAFEGKGYPLGVVDRETDGWTDTMSQNKILDTTSNPPICIHSQQDQPRLKAAPGDHVALQYQENGHVTDPDLTTRPYRGGNVYVYGTSDKSQQKDGINDVLNSWDATGKGGNGKGKMIASHYFDDGRCYQDRGGADGYPIYTERQSKYGADAVLCQSDFQVPKDLPTSGIYTIMWVWDWPQFAEGDTTHKPITEIYTSCAEIELIEPHGSSVDAMQVKVADSVPVTAGAIESQLSTLVEATALGSYTNSPDPVKIPAATGNPTTPTPTQGAGGGEGGDSQPSSTPTPSGGNGGGCDDGDSDSDPVTVTVTAEPVTTTAFRTVTVDAIGNSLGLGLGDAAAAASTTFTTTTTTVPMQSFKPRMTGAARRSASWYA